MYLRSTPLLPRFTPYRKRIAPPFMVIRAALTGSSSESIKPGSGYLRRGPIGTHVRHTQLHAAYRPVASNLFSRLTTLYHRETTSS